MSLPGEEYCKKPLLVALRTSLCRQLSPLSVGKGGPGQLLSSDAVRGLDHSAHVPQGLRGEAGITNHPWGGMPYGANVHFS